MANPSWVFKQLPKGLTDNDAVGSQFFNLQSLKDQALARESGQNSLDSNKDNDDKLVLKLNLVEKSEDTIANNPYLSSIYKHSSNHESGLSARNPDRNKKFRYLVIEDFNTNGVRGDLLFTDDDDNGNDNSHQDLYHLFRSLQRTGKGAEESSNKQLGSWGMGKNMYAQTSDLGCFLGYSIRDHEQKDFLFGMSILQIHKIDGIKYNSTGNFGTGEIDPEDITKPIVEQKTIADFKNRFNLERNDEKGLSIVIPCVYDKVTYDMLVKTFLETWMYAILSDRIELHIKSGDNNAILDKASILNYLHYFEDSDRQDIDRKIRYAMMAVRAKKSDFIKVPIPESHSKPQWSQNYLVKKSLESWQNKLEENDKIYFRVPVKIVYSDDKEDITGHFDVFIFKDSDITAGNSVQFIRDILIIPGVRPRIRLIKGYHALIRVEDTLANVLRESEGPAHMEWSRELEKYKALKLKYGGELISFVSHAAANLKRYMVSVSRSTYDDVLADLLPFFITGDIKKKKKKKKKSTIDPPIVPPLSMPTICNANEISGGFKMTDNSEWDDDKMIGMEYKIKIAFDVSEGGTPFNKYRDFQFKISDLSASTQKITNLRIDNNIVRFDVNARGWHYQLTGFPEDYQLILDITRS